MASPVLKLQYRNTFIDALVEEESPEASGSSRRSNSMPPRMSLQALVSEEEYLNALTEMLKDGSPASRLSTECESGQLDLESPAGSQEIEIEEGLSLGQGLPSPRLGFQLLPSPGTLGHPEVCKRPCMHFQMGHCLNGTACNFCHAGHAEKPAKLDKKQRLLLQTMKPDEFSVIILQFVRERLAMAPTAAQEVGHDLVNALSAKAGNASWPSLLERDLKNLKKTLARMNVSNLIGVLNHKFSQSEREESTELISIAVEKLRWHFLTEEI